MDISLAPPPAELASAFTRPLDCFIKVFRWEILPVCIFALLLGLNVVVANHRGKFHLKHRRPFVALTHRDSRRTTGDQQCPQGEWVGEARGVKCHHTSLRGLFIPYVRVQRLNNEQDQNNSLTIFIPSSFAHTLTHFCQFLCFVWGKKKKEIQLTYFK